MNEVIEYILAFVAIAGVVVGTVAGACYSSKDNAANYKDQNGVDRTQNRMTTR